ncbi:hypothetical protein Tco_0513670 [Tanacetum coccineum]
MVHWSSWGNKGHLRSRGDDNGVVSAHEIRSSVSYEAYTYPYARAWSRIQNPGRANGVLPYFSLRDEETAARPPKDQG